MKHLQTILLVAVYLAAVVVANLTVTHYGPEWSIYNALLLIGVDLTLRDQLHDRWSGPKLWPLMAALIGTGSLLSYLLGGSAKIATASAIAFACAGVVDLAVYQAVKRWRWIERVNTSNLASSATDSLVFPTLAFGAFLWPIVVGQFAAKVAGGMAWSLVVGWWRDRHAAARAREWVAG